MLRPTVREVWLKLPQSKKSRPAAHAPDGSKPLLEKGSASVDFAQTLARQLSPG